MGVSLTDVEHVARLAKLRLDPHEAHRMVAELNDILDHVDALALVDVDGVEPFTHATDAALPLRADEGSPDELQSELHTFGTAVRDGFFTVPRLAAQRGPGGDGSPARADGGA